MPLYDFVSKTVETTPAHPFLSFEDQTWTYQEADQAILDISKGLLEAGVKRGDRVATFIDNHPDALFSYLSCFRIGAVLVSLNHRYKLEEFSYAIKTVSASVLITKAEMFEQLNEHRDNFPSIKKIFIIGDKTYEKTQTFNDLISLGKNSNLDLPSVNDNDKALILYTSGSTASPKAVVHNHINLMENGKILAKEYGITAQSKALFSKNLGYMSCYGVTLTPAMYAGASLVLIPEMDAESIIKAIDHYKITNTHIAPITLVDMLHHPDLQKHDFASIVCCSIGGDKVPEELYNKFNEIIPNKIMINCGMTECTAYALNKPGKEFKHGTIGKDFPGVQTQIQDDAGNELPAGEPGEFCIKTIMMLDEYWENPQENAQAFQNGWFRTGDIGYRDQDGYLWFVDRKKNVIVCGNSNVSPLEVESVLHQHEAVKQVCVVGAPDKECGEIVIAFATIDKQFLGEINDAALKTHVAEHLSDYKVPSKILLIDEMPFTATGKVDRKTLKERALNLITS